MEVLAHREVFEHLLETGNIWRVSRISKEMLHCFGHLLWPTYLVVRHKSPSENAHFLVERDLVDTAGQVGAVGVNDVLVILAQANVERLQIYLALHNFEQSVELINRQVFNDCLRHCSDFLLSGVLGEGLANEVSVDLFERGVSPIYQVTQIVD